MRNIPCSSQRKFFIPKSKLLIIHWFVSPCYFNNYHWKHNKGSRGIILLVLRLNNRAKVIFE